MAGKAKGTHGFGKKLKDQQVTNKELYNVAGGVPTQASSSIVSAGSQGGGTYQNNQGADINMNTYDIIDVDRLKFAVKEGAGDLLTNTDYGIEALYVAGDAYGMWFRIPAVSAEANPTSYIFYHGDDQKFRIDTDEIGLNDDVSITGYLDMNDLSNPDAPPANYRRIFVDEDNSDHLTVKRSDGTEIDLEAGVSGANVTLSNLTDPTTINANLEPDNTAGHADERDLGHDDKIWAKAYIKDIYNTGIIRTESADHEMQFYTGGTQRLAISDNSSNGAGYAELFGVIAGTGETQTHPSYKTVATDASPADNDMVGALGFDGYNSATERLTWARIVGVSDVVTDSAETAHFEFKAFQSGTEKTMLETDQFGIYLSNDMSGGSSPAYNGAIYRDGNDIKCYTGGAEKSLSDIGTGSGGANTTLSNLGTTSINADLIPEDLGKDLGSSTKKWNYLWSQVGTIDYLRADMLALTTTVDLGSSVNRFGKLWSLYCDISYPTFGTGSTSDNIEIEGRLQFGVGYTADTTLPPSPSGKLSVGVGGSIKYIYYYDS